ncbi:YjbH domain-containing protein [Vibrio coralliilyticus]|uniref:YjbH domain-containing protein n=1 Tax=Vibrio coralliilyticus TaxID=190893 RepID=UPI001560351F|nr:YjbH domain-containing protein [Vibrio coralliilyticus]NRF27150.1 YjbH domain-containing protein [Vibrio coralliilyticus]NRF81420.1 YjbH domain-containing protein [Vibrio coralliilyticus]
MKLNAITSLFLSLGFVSTVQASDNLKVSQTDFGGVGLMQMPSGRMAEEGEFNIGVSVNNDYQQYTASIQLMTWLESTVRYTRVPDLLFSSDPSYSGDNLYTDKGIDFKVRLWQEGYWLPETSIGVRDFGGTGLFDGEFIAATKRFGNLDVTLGLGWGYLGQRGNVANPFCKANDKYCNREDDYKGTGGSVDYERWFKGPAAVFGGLEYQTPYKPLRLKLEYDGNDYTQDFPVVRAGKPMPQQTPWNIGVNYRLGDWGDAKVSYQRGDTITFGINIYTNFNDMKATWRDEPKQAVTNVDNNNPDWQSAAKQIESNAGFEKNSITLDGDTIIVKGQQKKYRNREEALDRTAAILSNNSNDLIRVFKVVEQQDGMDLKETTIDKQKYLTAANYLSTEAKVKDSFEEYEPRGIAKTPIAENKERWDYGLEPVLKQSIGGPESFYLYSLGISANSNYWLTDNLEFGGSIIFNLVDNYDKFNYVENSPHVRNYSTPRVRTMFRAYVHDNPVRLNHLQLTWFEQPFEEVYTQVYGGYLEMMFAGVGGEVLYRPMNTNWAVGFDANLVSQRDPDSWFGTYSEDYFFYDEAACNDPTPSCQAYVLSQGTTGHVTGYYMPNWDFLRDTLFKVSAGKFLGGDIGARFDFSKQFKSGVIVGAYATFTDLTAEEYGEGSYNKGFYISIPLDIMTIKPSTGRAKISWEPITRDGGQMLNKQYNLFDKTDVRSQWYQRPSTVE